MSTFCEWLTPVIEKRFPDHSFHASVPPQPETTLDLRADPQMPTPMHSTQTPSYGQVITVLWVKAIHFSPARI
jgi:hypothetical protein